VEKSTALFHAFHSLVPFLFLCRRSLYFVLFLDRGPHHAPENLNILRKIALSLLRSTPVKGRISAKAKISKAILNPDFLSLALFGQ
jgi:hypothetical protein